jgi:very-short-patch-repair endonuclease
LDNFYNGWSKCKQCSRKNIPVGRKKGDCYGAKFTEVELLKIFNKKHNFKYSYPNLIDRLSTTKIPIICPKHGIFYQKISEHKSGRGCYECGIRKGSGNILNNELFINKANKKHNFSYDYSLCDYTVGKNKVEILCPKHGIFIQQAESHLNGAGCPKCSESKGERKIREFLEENNISYEQEVKLFGNYRFDFYLEDLNTVIEYDGKQHFEPVNYFGGLEGFLKTQERDKIKTEYCLENNIRIIRIAYFEEVEKILKEIK